MILQRSGRGIGRCQYLDPEALKQAARLERWLAQLCVKRVIDVLRVLTIERLLNAKDIA